MQLLEEKNRLGMENTSLRRQLDDLNARMKNFEFSMQNQYGPPIMTNGEQVRILTNVSENLITKNNQKSTLNEYFESDDESSVRFIINLLGVAPVKSLRNPV